MSSRVAFDDAVADSRYDFSVQRTDVACTFRSWKKWSLENCSLC